MRAHSPLAAAKRSRIGRYRNPTVFAYAASFLLHAIAGAICFLTPAGSPTPSPEQPPELLAVCGIAFVPLPEPVLIEEPAETPAEPPPPELPLPEPEPIEPELPHESFAQQAPEPRPPEALAQIDESLVPDAPAETAPRPIPDGPPRPDEPQAPPPKPRYVPEKPSAPPQKGSHQATVRAEPMPTHNPPPAYPKIAQRKGYEGLVVLLVRVSRRGACLSVEVRRSSGYRVLDDAAVDGVRRWRFRPATIGGRPVEGEVEVPIRFQLTD